MEASAADNHVAQQTAEPVNQKIRQQTADELRHYAKHPEEIDERLQEIEQEWDIERWLQVNAASLISVGLGLGAFVSRRWLALPAVVAAFLAQHALQGWCPPVPLFRRLGVRTKAEILQERYALKALRGDFDKLGEVSESAPHVRLRRIRKALGEG